MVVSALLATLGVVRDGWPRAVRVALLVPALAITGMMLGVAFESGSVVRGVLGSLIYPALFYPMLLGMRVGIEGRSPASRAATTALSPSPGTGVKSSAVPR